MSGSTWGEKRRNKTRSEQETQWFRDNGLSIIPNKCDVLCWRWVTAWFYSGSRCEWREQWSEKEKRINEARWEWITGYYSYLLHVDTEVVVAVGGHRPGAVVQQVDLFGAPAGTMVADVICQPKGIDEFNRLRLQNRPKGLKEIVKKWEKRASGGSGLLKNC